MRTVRRLYFYVLALVGSQAGVWGAVNLLRNLREHGLSGEITSLAGGLSALLVGLPVFVLHWQIAQRDAAHDEEERSSRIRAVFLYAARAWTLVPTLYGALALLNRLLAGLMGLAPDGALLGGGQSASDNLIAIAVNLAAYLFFTRALAEDWRQAQPGNFLADARRLYRYLWLVFGLSLTIFAVQGMLSYLFTLPPVLDRATGYRLANSLALAMVGAPAWALTWFLLQEAQDQPGEAASILRLVTFYAISLAGVVGTLAAGGRALSDLFALIFGRAQTLSGFLDETGPALAALVPLAVTWAYYGRALEREMTGMAHQPRRTGVRRLYRALLAALGLATTFAALFSLINYLSASFFAGQQVLPTWTPLNSGLAALTIGLPLWLAAWLPAQAECAARGESGDRARRSLVRRTYLYLFAFLFVVGLMLAAGDLFYQLISHLLGSPVEDIAPRVAARLLTLTTLATLLAYHLHVLRRDAHATQQTLGSLHLAFPVLVIVREEMELAEEIVHVLHRQAPRLPVQVHALERGAPDDEMLTAKLVVLPANLAIEPPEVLELWLSAHSGRRLILPQAREGWIWLGLAQRPLHEQAEEAAAAIRQAAEGNAPRAGLPASPWAVAGYLLGGLFTLQLALGLFVILINSLFD
jgi:hypothetical protein